MRLLLLTASLGLLACSSADDASTNNNTADSGTTGATLTYHEHAEPILQNSCQSCHRAGGIAPMPLTTYAEVKKWAALVKTKMADRSMPPWGAFATDDCKPRHGLKGDLGVPQSDIDTIVKWVDQGAVEGDPSKAPPPKTFTDNVLAEPTHSATITPHTVAPADRDEHVCIPVDPKFTEDTWIDGVQLTPGNTKVVHHIVMYADPTSASIAKAGSAGSYPCFGGSGVPSAFVVAGWVPGMQPTNYPAGAAMRIPAGSKLVLQMHYHPGATPETDASKVVLRAAKTSPTYSAVVRLVGNATSAPRLQPGPNDTGGSPTFLIPAGAKGHTEEMVFTADADAQIAAITPHMHWAGKELKAYLERATEPAKECLISAPKYDFNWQRGYAYDAAIEALPKIAVGDKLRIKCTYDNSMDNPYVAGALAEKKLTTPQDIRMGEDTLDEMCLIGVTAYVRIK